MTSRRPWEKLCRVDFSSAGIDLDGVLVDKHEYYLEAWRKAFTEAGIMFDVSLAPYTWPCQPTGQKPTPYRLS